MDIRKHYRDNRHSGGVVQEMTDANLDHLHPTLRAIAELWLEEWKTTYPERDEAKITVTWRSPEDQQKAYDAGLSNAKPGQGKHEFMLDDKPAAKAFDFALYEDGDYIADGSDDWYTDAGVIAEKLGLKWGGRWHKPDYDHIEMAT